MKQQAVAPDGTEIEVNRNHGKPTQAATIAAALKEKALALKEKRAARRATLPAVASPPRSTENTESTEAVSPNAAAAIPRPSVVSVSSVDRPEAAAKAGKAKPSRTDAEPATQKARAAESSSEPTTPPSSPAPPASLAPSPNAPATTTKSVPSAGPSPNPKKSMQVRFTGMKPAHIVEAALFSAGKPIAVEEIAETTGLPPDVVKKAVKELQETYAKNDTVLEVGKAGTKWAMQVRSQAAEPASKFAPMEIPAKTLKTLALIAYHQPMKQADLVHMMGSKVYDHIPELVSRGLIRAREEGATKILVTTAAFPEYFGLDASNPEEIRRTMGKLVGIEAPPKEKVPSVTYEDTQTQVPTEPETDTPPT